MLNTESKVSMTRTRTPRNVFAKFDATNLESAHIIASDPKRYPGGAQEWAQLVIARLGVRSDAPTTERSLDR
jgi:hypothetical protein